MLNTKYLIAAVSFSVLIFGLSSIPGRSFPGDGSLTGKIITNLAHIPEYALASILWLKAFKRELFSWLSYGNLMLLLGLCLFAVLDEVHQSFVPGRTASMVDIGLDLFGIIFGFWVFRVVNCIQNQTA